MYTIPARKPSTPGEILKEEFMEPIGLTLRARESEVCEGGVAAAGAAAACPRRTAIVGEPGDGSCGTASV